MARLTEQEIDLIQQARRESECGADELDHSLAVGRQLRAAAMVRMIAHATDVVARVTGLKLLSETVIRPIRNTLKRRETLGQLRRLDDRMLDDIGLDRSMIYGYAADLSSTEPAAARPTLIERFRAWRRERATVRELEGLSDHLLADMGLARSEISRVVHEAALAERRPARAKDVVAEIDRSAAESYRRRAMRALSRRIAKLESTQPPKIDFVDVRA